MRIFFGILAVIALGCMVFTFISHILEIKHRLSQSEEN
jgi:hypothetical protein